MEKNVRETATERMRADKLTVGQHLAPGQLVTGRPTEIVFIDIYPQGASTEVLIVHRPVGAKHVVPTPVDASRYFTLATDAEVEAAREAGERDNFIAGLHEFADWLKANPWAPIKDDGRYVHQARVQINLRAADVATVAQIRELAGRLGVKVDESLDDRTDASVEIGSVSYSVIAWHQDGRPVEPEPEREGRWFEVGDRVYPFPNGGEVVTVTEVAEIAGSKPLRQQFRANGKTIWRHSDQYQPRDPDPTGLLYTRADDEADALVGECLGLTLTAQAREVLAVAPVSPARVPMHIGVVDDEPTREDRGPVVQICQPHEVAAASKAFGLPVVSDDPDDPYHHENCGGCGGTKTDDDCPYAVRLRNYVDSLPYPPSQMTQSEEAAR